MKSVLAFVICLTIATPALCQSTSNAGGTSAQESQQEKEQQLRTALQQMRDAIDRYHGMFIRGKITAKAGSQGYPPDLETLVKGAVDEYGQTIHFLPKIPVDPMTGNTDWGFKTLPQGSVFDVYTKSEDKALDGTKYKDW